MQLWPPACLRLLHSCMQPSQTQAQHRLRPDADRSWHPLNIAKNYYLLQILRLRPLTGASELQPTWCAPLLQSSCINPKVFLAGADLNKVLHIEATGCVCADAGGGDEQPVPESERAGDAPEIRPQGLHPGAMPASSALFWVPPLWSAG